MLIKGWNFIDDSGELNINYSIEFTQDSEDGDFSWE